MRHVAMPRDGNRIPSHSAQFPARKTLIFTALSVAGCRQARPGARNQIFVGDSRRDAVGNDDDEIWEVSSTSGGSAADGRTENACGRQVRRWLIIGSTERDSPTDRPAELDRTRFDSTRPNSSDIRLNSEPTSHSRCQNWGKRFFVAKEQIYGGSCPQAYVATRKPCCGRETARCISL